jgi:O-antigen ligase
VDFLDSNAVFVLAAAGLAGVYVTFFACAGNKTAARVLLFAVIISFDVTLRTRDIGDKSLDAQVLAKLAIWGAGGIFALSRWERIWPVLIRPVATAWLAVLAWFAASAAYSPNPPFSLMAIVTMLCMLLFFIAIVFELDEGSFGSVILAGAGTVAAVSLVGYFAFPDATRLWLWSETGLNRTTRLAGITSHPNAIGELASLGLLVARLFWSQMNGRSRWINVTFVGLCAAALFLSESRTALGALLIALSINQLGRFSWSARPAVLIGVATFMLASLLAMLIYGSDTTLSLLSRSGNPTEILTLTGRTQIWQATVALWQASPLVGWGYGSGAFLIPKLSSAIGFVVAQPHNLVLLIMVSGGLVALGLFAVAVVVTLRSLVRAGSPPATAFLAWLFVGGLTEAVAFSSIVDLSFAALSIGIGFVAAAEGVRGAVPRGQPAVLRGQPAHARLR